MLTWDRHGTHNHPHSTPIFSPSAPTHASLPATASATFISFARISLLRPRTVLSNWGEQITYFVALCCLQTTASSSSALLSIRTRKWNGSA
jgi:hypothetical protein